MSERTGDQANSFGMTDHSLASTTGASTSPQADVQALRQLEQAR
ncbi:hypothetical protein [Amycolatopsis methanolica]